MRLLLHLHRSTWYSEYLELHPTWASQCSSSRWTLPTHSVTALPVMCTAALRQMQQSKLFTFVLATAFHFNISYQWEIWKISSPTKPNENERNDQALSKRQLKFHEKPFKVNPLRMFLAMVALMCIENQILTQTLLTSEMGHSFLIFFELQQKCSYTI